jgi:rhodanese-related sulfurtransferase
MNGIPVLIKEASERKLTVFLPCEVMRRRQQSAAALKERLSSLASHYIGTLIFESQLTAW